MVCGFTDGSQGEPLGEEDIESETRKWLEEEPAEIWKPERVCHV